MKIATKHAEAESKCARAHMVVWLLFHGITLGTGYIAIGDHQFAAAVEADLADAGSPVRDGALVATGKAADALVTDILEGRA